MVHVLEVRRETPDGRRRRENYNKDDNVLMINNTEARYYMYRSSEFSVAANTKYLLQVDVRTANLNGGEKKARRSKSQKLFFGLVDSRNRRLCKFRRGHRRRMDDLFLHYRRKIQRQHFVGTATHAGQQQPARRIQNKRLRFL